jgi:hypothetical protein
MTKEASLDEGFGLMSRPIAPGIMWYLRICGSHLRIAEIAWPGGRSIASRMFHEDHLWEFKVAKLERAFVSKGERDGQSRKAQ